MFIIPLLSKFRVYISILTPVSIINKLKSVIANDGKLDDDNDELISYYDLLSFLRFGITFRKVLYQKFDKEEIYYYDNEGNYVIENLDNKSDVFSVYLSECKSDNTKFNRNIRHIEK